MNFLGNILWLLLGGLLTAVLYYLNSLLMCITIVGIPFGVQLFKSDGDKSFQRNDHFDSVFRITVNINISLADQTFAVKNLFDIATDFFGE